MGGVTKKAVRAMMAGHKRRFCEYPDRALIAELNGASWLLIYSSQSDEPIYFENERLIAEMHEMLWILDRGMLLSKPQFIANGKVTNYDH